jgi:hypothetical protein
MQVQGGDQLKRSIDDQSQLLRDVLGSLKDVLSTLKERRSDDPGMNMAAVLQSMQSSSDVKAELSAIKTLLLANLVRPNNSSNANGDASALNASTMADVSQLMAALSTPTANYSPGKSAAPPKAEESPKAPPTAEELEESKKNEGITKARNALTEMVKKCPADQDDLLAAGCGLLLMFLRNLLKEPLNPRYRRVARTNANFKKSLEPLSGYLEFFEAVGFEERGSQMELKQEWTESLEKDEPAQSGWARAIIEDAISNLEAVREQRSPYVQQSSPPSKPGKPNTPVPARWEPPSSSSAAKEPVQNPVPPPPSSSTAPAYPLSFAEVAKLHAEGKRPDGIKDIPDKISSDEPSKPSMQAPPKPWEKSSAASSPATSFTPPPPFTLPGRGGYKPNSTVEIVELDENESSRPSSPVNGNEQ